MRRSESCWPPLSYIERRIRGRIKLKLETELIGVFRFALSLNTRAEAEKAHRFGRPFPRACEKVLEVARLRKCGAGTLVRGRFEIVKLHFHDPAVDAFAQTRFRHALFKIFIKAGNFAHAFFQGLKVLIVSFLSRQGLALG